MYAAGPKQPEGQSPGCEAGERAGKEAAPRQNCFLTDLALPRGVARTQMDAARMCSQGLCCSAQAHLDRRSLDPDLVDRTSLNTWLWSSKEKSMMTQVPGSLACEGQWQVAGHVQGSLHVSRVLKAVGCLMLCGITLCKRPRPHLSRRVSQNRTHTGRYD